MTAAVPSRTPFTLAGFLAEGFSTHPPSPARPAGVGSVRSSTPPTAESEEPGIVLPRQRGARRVALVSWMISVDSELNRRSEPLPARRRCALRDGSDWALTVRAPVVSADKGANCNITPRAGSRTQKQPPAPPLPTPPAPVFHPLPPP